MACARLVDEVLVVDGSPADVYERHAVLLAGVATHMAPEPRDRCANGKAWAVLTGLRHARNDAVVIADDDVRWNESALAAVTEALQRSDMRGAGQPLRADEVACSVGHRADPAQPRPRA